MWCVFVCVCVPVRYVKEWMKRMYCFLSFWFSIRLNTIPSVEWHSFFLVRTTIVVYVCVCMSVRIWIFELCWQWNYFEQRERQREMFRQVSNISFCECVYLWMCVCTYKYICMSIRPMHIFWICLRSSTYIFNIHNANWPHTINLLNKVSILILELLLVLL